MAIDLKLIDKLLADYKKPEDIIGESGLLKQLTKALLERPRQCKKNLDLSGCSQYRSRNNLDVSSIRRGSGIAGSVRATDTGLHRRRSPSPAAQRRGY